MSKFKLSEYVVATSNIGGYPSKNRIGIIQRVDHNNYYISFLEMNRSMWINADALIPLSEVKVPTKDIIKVINMQFDSVKLFLQNFKGQYTISKGQIKLKSTKKEDEVESNDLPF